jgi:hypothetical protein
MSSPKLLLAMTPASTGKFTVARAAVILFSASLTGGFVWYSHIKAQPRDVVTATEGATSRPMILPGSKRANTTIVPDDIVLREDGTIDLNLESTAGQPSTVSNSKEGTILPSSKLGIFRDMVSNPNSPPATGSGTPAPPAPIMLSGSKSFAGPVFSTSQTGILTVGKGEKETSTVQGPGVTKQAASPPPRAMMGSSKGLSQIPIRTEELSNVVGKEGLSPAKVKGADAPAPAWNQNSPIFSSSKSTTVFKPTPQPPAPVQAQAATSAPASKTQTPAPTTKPETAPKPQPETPVPVSP